MNLTSRLLLGIALGTTVSLVAGCSINATSHETESSTSASTNSNATYGNPLPSAPAFRRVSANGSFSFTDIPGVDLGERQWFNLQGSPEVIQSTYTNPMVTETYSLDVKTGDISITDWGTPRVFKAPQNGGTPLAYAESLETIIANFKLFSPKEWTCELDGQSIDDSQARADAIAPFSQYLSDVGHSFTGLFLERQTFVLNTDCSAVGAQHKNITVETSGQSGLRVHYEDYGWFDLKRASGVEEEASCTKWWVVERNWECPNTSAEVLRQTKSLVEKVKDGNACSPAQPALGEVLTLIDWHIARLSSK